MNDLISCEPEILYEAIYIWRTVVIICQVQIIKGMGAKLQNYDNMWCEPMCDENGLRTAL